MLVKNEFDVNIGVRKSEDIITEESKDHGRSEMDVHSTRQPEFTRVNRFAALLNEEDEIRQVLDSLIIERCSEVTFSIGEAS